MLQEMGVISVINNSEWGYNIVNKINKFIKIEMPKIKKKSLIEILNLPVPEKRLKK